MLFAHYTCAGIGRIADISCVIMGYTLSKIRIESKKVSNKSCLELNFVPRSPRAHMSISPRGWSQEA